MTVRGPMADEKPTRTDLAAQRFKNSRIGLVLLVIIAVFAIMASFLEDFEVVRCWQGADLIVETLEVQNSVSPLAGLEPRKTEDGELAFVEGFMIQVPIRHNQCSDASILIRGLKVDIAESSINSTPSAVNLEELPPQGANVSHGFLAVLNDESAQSVTWTLADSRTCLLYTSPSPRDRTRSRMPSSA
eukprot:TRINITY_DN9243_c0_g1_i1.p1 TRINITY_DN9243_c0_g1~~TRINITY_DN9243_c0_g1_i1.p1  ORF type:complete len:188 (-),score=15.80 TRINITY_DN9243_c0_g1_i1:73-636(-)